MARDYKKTVVMGAGGGDIARRGVCGWLVALNGVTKGKDFKIREGNNSVGSDPSGDVVLEDDHISGLHCHIKATVKPDGNQYMIVDMDSTNGTFLNDEEERVHKEEIVDGDIVIFARTRFKFKCI